MKIGVFDSGVGGQSVVNAIQKELPDHAIIYATDKEHVPYGTRAPEEILEFVVPILQKMVDEDCRVIVIACNTVSTTLIDKLRDRFSIPLIAMEPMVKPAAELTKTNIIAVCATPATLASSRYNWLKETYAKNIKVIEPDCSDWAYMIEQNEIDEHKISLRITDAIKEQADVIVLGCTHYHWIEELIKEIAGERAIVLQPEQPVIIQLKKVLAQLA